MGFCELSRDVDHEQYPETGELFEFVRFIFGVLPDQLGLGRRMRKATIQATMTPMMMKNRSGLVWLLGLSGGGTGYSIDAWMQDQGVGSG